ncbi:VPLPA-CTERM sorting domain-containing protein [Pseudooceanicola sp.]|uniref:VPLPA-CTERM sorting domain-containing protein n=1 Tax=Pseudooceanicola sp. TaxID=1914328 RepID=UPI0035C73395
MKRILAAAALAVMGMAGAAQAVTVVSKEVVLEKCEVFYSTIFSTTGNVGATVFEAKIVGAPCSGPPNTDYKIVAVVDTPGSFDRLTINGVQATFQDNGTILEIWRTPRALREIDRTFTFSFNAIAPAVLTFSAMQVPLPAGAWLMVSGIGGLAAIRSRRRSLEIQKRDLLGST